MSGPAPFPSEQLRPSAGLDQLFQMLAPLGTRQVLDLGEFTQNNVTQIVNLGHRLTFEDVLGMVDQTFGPGDPAIVQADGRLSEQFLDATLQFPAESFDAILVWNVLEYLGRHLVEPVVERLRYILRPGGLMLVCFRADGREAQPIQQAFRIADSRTLAVLPKGHRQPAHLLSTRAIERVFERFGSVKFFLSRDAVREVIVRK